jgi:hypothetical protein
MERIVTGHSVTRSGCYDHCPDISSRDCYGLSAVWILHDILSALAGEQLEAFKFFSPIEEKILGPSPRRARTSESDRAVPVLPQTRPAAPLLPANPRTNIDTAEFSKEETARLIERCRANNTTVHSMICAAAARCIAVSGQDIVGRFGGSADQGDRIDLARRSPCWRHLEQSPIAGSGD